ncbi:hypothetical protein M9H77_06446 [Catharanthus roseus]|uniref:Uncharacterized protein n=1 Tax=Catharanthus roseus TaxID=4058 RepID=A0ACC0BS36_CATRO|nr:hypothetical protein M9H77_06446 [Catharanthus roseus]
MEKIQAHRYVLLEYEAVKPFIDEFRDHIKRRSKRRKPSATEVEKRVYKEFSDWFRKRIMNPNLENTVSTDLKFLARGPMLQATRYMGYNINGFKFRTLSREQGLKTQNCGVFLISATSCVASSFDRNMRITDLPYYGKLEDIIELNYHRCFTRDRGYKRGSWNFNCVSFDRLIHTSQHEDHDPYVIASQKQMVYYVEEESDKGLHMAVHLKPRDLYDMGIDDKVEVYENDPYQQLEIEIFFYNNYEISN